MSKRIPIKLSEELSALLNLDYEVRKDNYESYDEYIKDITEYLELQLIKEHHENELKRINKRIDELDFKRLGIPLTN